MTHTDHSDERFR